MIRRLLRLIRSESAVIYECRNCGTTLEDTNTECPNCGSEDHATYFLEGDS